MVTSAEYRHVPTGTLAVLAQRLGKVWASRSTWYRLVRQPGWRRPRLGGQLVECVQLGLEGRPIDYLWRAKYTGRDVVHRSPPF